MSRKSYRLDQLQEAVNRVRNGEMTGRTASRVYGIPNSTIRNKLRGASDIGASYGPTPYLTKAEETMISKWILNMANAGYAVKRSDVEDTVQKIVLDDGRKTPFKDGRPGVGWFRAFMKRHPCVRETDSISRGGASVSEEQIRGWFNKLTEFLESHNLQEIMMDPTRIFSADEIIFLFNKNTGRYIGVRGKDLQSVAPSGEKENLTVLGTFNAAGISVPPLVLYKNKRMPALLKNALPREWMYALTDSGLMKGHAFFKYLTQFHSWLLKNQIALPIIIFIDGRRSHLTLEVSKFCSENGIIIYCLFPHSTHLLQPANVGIFSTLKCTWHDHLQNKHKIGDIEVDIIEKTVTKTTFAATLKPVWEEAITCDTVRSAFRKCGLFPFEPNSVSYEKCVLDTIEIAENGKVNKQSHDAEIALRMIEEIMDPSLLQIFKIHWENRTLLRTDNDGPLFHVWNAIKIKANGCGKEEDNPSGGCHPPEAVEGPEVVWNEVEVE